MLDRVEVERNMQGYLEQIGRILDMEKVETHYNSDWLSGMSFEEVTVMADNFSVAEMLDRENFINRYRGGKRISLREFLYPLMQGYDSVAIESDVELGGNDQLFNLLAGRTIQRAYGKEPQDIMTFGMLEGTDGRKMSTTYDNFIAIVDSPDEQFGKIMRLKDDLIITYFELCTTMPKERIDEINTKLAGGLNPMEAKLLLAETIVAFYHTQEQAMEARDRFIQVFRKREVPNDVPARHVKQGTWQLPVLLATLGLTTSRSEAGRLIRSGAVRIDGEREQSIERTIVVGDEAILIQVGKRRMAKISASEEQ
jgi:tyrosyl-tRNA synthetase